MSKTDKTSEIITSLHDYIERQKGVLEEENERLLKRGEQRFEELITEKQNQFSKSIEILNTKPSNKRIKIQHLFRSALSKVRMRPSKLLNRARQAHPKRVAGEVMHGRSSIVGAMGWMFGLTLLLTLVLGWVPIVGPFIGPVVGGYLGGRRAGNVLRALLAALLPALLLSLFIIGLGTLAASLADRPIIGAVGVIIAGALGVILVIHNLLLFLAAFVGGLIRRLEGV